MGFIAKNWINDLDYLHSDVVRHLEDLFKLPIYELSGYVYNPDFSRGSDTLGSEFVVYEITHFGDDKEFITTDEDQSNFKIYLWVFDDKVVFALDI